MGRFGYARQSMSLTTAHSGVIIGPASAPISIASDPVA